MLWLYGKVAAETGRRVVKGWPALLALPIYPIILGVAGALTAPAGMIGGFILGFVIAACWSSYLELISQVVEGVRVRLNWDDFKKTFAPRFWDVVSVMFAFFIISLVTMPLLRGPHALALSAIIGFAIAFFFNAVPELLYQGSSRSFALLIDSARFVTDHPVSWLLPNIAFGALALWASGNLRFNHPTELLIVFGNTFSSPDGVLSLLQGLPLWALPLAVVAAHTAMVFRGILFRELSSGGGNARMRAFKARMR
ncbi:MAG: hypothetical protein QM756_41705 [Polyangiaceae bacterium]